MLAIITSNVSQAQTVKKTMIAQYPAFSIAPFAGVSFPIGDLGNYYKSSFNAGIDFNLKVNREVSFFLNVGYYDMPSKPDVAAPGASFISITAGPRYVLSSANVKAKFFMEAGLGAYIFGVKEYTTTTAPIVTTPSTSTVNFGVNTGPGVILPLSDSMDLMLKTKLHYVFNKNGSSTFLSALIGLDFKL
ncbi:MAG: hypothetical protein JST55_06415 [Bacteroidetes bacterium]|nr:hypothetical protein [Bacteroidota bacterium]